MKRDSLVFQAALVRGNIRFRETVIRLGKLQVRESETGSSDASDSRMSA